MREVKAEATAVVVAETVEEEIDRTETEIDEETNKEAEEAESYGH